jgi:2,3-bisphosphoglycerate-dependent phosphoglycerate mutase
MFTGWVDIPLSEKGIEEAIKAGKAIRDIPIDIIFCSTLIRATMTAMIAMAYHSDEKTPVIQHKAGKLHSWGKIYSPEEEKRTVPVFMNDALNERMYGELQGLNKQAMREQFGAEQVQIWRRSYSTPPPSGESLEMTTERSIPYFVSTILPKLHQGMNVLVSAHGNSLRGIVKYLDNLSADEVVHLEIATGVPLFYQFTGEKYVKL